MEKLEQLRSALEKHKSEVILLVLAVAGILISGYLLYLTGNEEKNLSEESISIDSPKAATTYVEISGAVNKPDVYEITFNMRLGEVLKKAGGLSLNADRLFFSRNFNLSQILQDQQKIYVPSREEILEGVMPEASPISNTPVEPEQPQAYRVNLNTASVTELDTLPGIGKITAAKIMSNRPYGSIEDLVAKNVVKLGVFTNLKELISVD